MQNMQKMQKNTDKCREMQRHVEKCRETQRSVEKCREMQLIVEKCRGILMTFMTHENVIFDILEPHAIRKNSTCWVLQKFEEPCRILKKFVHACVVNVIHAKVLPGSVL